MNSSWVCTACSYSNPNSVNRCSLCNSLRPSRNTSDKTESSFNTTVSIPSSMEINGVNTLSQQSSKLFSIETNKANPTRKTLGAKGSISNSQRLVGLSKFGSLKSTLSLTESDIPKSGEVSRHESIEPEINNTTNEKEVVTLENEKSVEMESDSHHSNQTEVSSAVTEVIPPESQKETEEHDDKPKEPVEATTEIKKRSTPTTERSHHTTSEKKERSIHKEKTEMKKKVPLVKLVGTMLDEVDRDVMSQLIMYLPNAKLMKRKSISKANVVVTGRSARSVKVMEAVARGCTVVNKQWLYDCLESHSWLPVDNYIDNIAKDGLNMRRKSKHGVFYNIGPFYIDQGTSPSYMELKSVIEAGDGKVTRNVDKASICICHQRNEEMKIPCVTELFVIESVIAGKSLQVEDYCLNDSEPAHTHENEDSEEFCVVCSKHENHQ